eukprot:COSAG01_NODE_5564_length_4180_cov_3.259740_3_plen_32_part_00
MMAYMAVSGRFHVVCGRFDWDLPMLRDLALK